MPTIRYSAESPLAPAAFLGALTDFSERRPQLFPNLDESYYRVHEVGDTWADVTEGTEFLGGVWERNRYDWSEPGLVRISVQDSNSFTRESYWEYRTIPIGATGGRVEVTAHRVGKNLKGWFVALLVAVAARRRFQKDLETTLAHLAASNQTPESGADASPAVGR